MSRSNKTEIVASPCTKFLQFKTIKESVEIDGESLEKIKGGTFVYFDKEKEEKVEIKLPFKFAILNPDMTTFKGFDEASKTGYWSTEGKDPNHIITVRSKDGKLMSFKLSEYKLNKDALSAKGIKYVKSVYIAVEVDGKWEIQNLQLQGGSLSGAPADFNNLTEDERLEGWINFTKLNKNKLYSNFVEVTGYRPKKKGATKFTIPVYELGEEIDAETSEILNSLDKELNSYLDYYFARPEDTKEEVKELVEQGELDY